MWSSFLRLFRCRHRRYSLPRTLPGEAMPHVTCRDRCLQRIPYSMKRLCILSHAEAIEEYYAHGYFWPVPEYSLTLTTGDRPEESAFDYSRLEPEQQYEVDQLAVGDAISFGGRFTVTRIN